MTGQGTGVYLR